MKDFKVFSHSSIGWKHEKHDGFNEDACGYLDEKDFEIIAVADGHGSRESFRSQIGSQLAIESALEILQTFKKTVDEYSLLQNLYKYDQREQLLRALIHDLIELWKAKVHDHIRKFPISKEEYEQLSSLSMVYQKGKYLTNIYGSTLICAILTKNYLLVIQQGDGCCVVLNDQGELLHPVPKDEMCIRNMTTSLCDRDAEKRARYYYYDMRGHSLGGVFLASDGIEKSFGNEIFLNAFYAELCHELVKVKNGNEDVYMRELLPKISEKGSKDDVTLSAIYNKRMMSKFNKKMDLYVDLARKQFAMQDSLRAWNRNKRQKRFIDKEFIKTEQGLADVEEKMNELVEKKAAYYRKKEWLSGEFSKSIKANEEAAEKYRKCKDVFDTLNEKLNSKQ